MLLANRRAARFFVGDGDGLEETDRVEDDVHSQHDQGGWSQSKYQRWRREGGGRPPRPRRRRRVRAFTSGSGFDRLLIGAPDELVGELERKLHPYLRERIAGRLQLDVENSGLDDIRAATEEAIEDGRGAASARRSTGWPRASAAAAAAPPGSPRCSTALNEARVETLLVADGFRSPGGARRRDRRCSTPRDDAPRGPELERCEDVVETRDREGDRAVGEVIGSRTTTTSARSAASAPCCGTDMRVAVLGTGIMGAPMARNLAAGRAMRSSPGTAPASGPSAAGRRRRSPTRPPTAVAGAEVVVTMLSDGDAVAAVDGRRRARRRGVGADEHGRRRGSATRRMAATRGVALVDAPVIGPSRPPSRVR